MPDNEYPKVIEKENPDLFHRTIWGGVWMVALRFTTQVISFARYIVLANLLGKQNMGLLGMAMLLIQTLETFSQTGFHTALIQKREDIHDHLNTAWTVKIIRGILLYLILFIVAPFLAHIGSPIEGSQAGTYVIRVLGLSMIIGSMSNIGTIYFIKDMDFHKRFFFETSGTLLSSVVTIVIAVVHKTVWALVWGRLVGELLKVSLSYLFHPYRPRFHFEFHKAKSLWKFGKWITFCSIVSFIMTNGDDYFVWGYLGLASLGLYQLAYRIAEAPATEFTLVIAQVAFPAYAKIQNDLPRLREAYLKVLSSTVMITIPLSGLIIFLANDFTHAFLTPEWYPMIPVMQVLAMHGLLHSVSATRGPVFQAMGRPDITAKPLLLRLLYMVVLIYPLTARWGILGTAWTLILASLLIQHTLFQLIVSVLHCNYWQTVRPIIYPVLGTLIMGIWVFSGHILFFKTPGYFSLFSLGITGIMIYLGVMILFERLFHFPFLRTLIELRAIVTRKNTHD
ncbi:MAG: oligosaccharide flippase family protein [Sedimentisphaerales bacterium]|nr:oligosaccharide flippase family protein [Sedimentisphaerales bacterium]